MTPVQDLYALLFAVAAFVAYTGFVAMKYKVTKSISASIHVLQGTWEKSLYSFFMLAIAIPLMLVSDTTMGWWAGALLAIDFAAPTGGDKLQNFLHCFGADVGMGLGMIMLCVDYHQYPIVIAGLVIIMILLFRKVQNLVWWIETVVFATAIIGLWNAKLIL